MFSSTVSSSISPSFCGTAATLDHGGEDASTGSCHRTSPDVGRSHPAITFSRVVLPEPDRPTRPTSSPGLASKLTDSSACTTSPPWWRNIFVSSWTDTVASKSSPGR